MVTQETLKQLYGNQIAVGLIDGNTGEVVAEAVTVTDVGMYAFAVSTADEFFILELSDADYSQEFKRFGFSKFCKRVVLVLGDPSDPPTIR
jgi:hypothetical protein